MNAIWGATLGYCSLWLIYWIFKYCTHKEGLGFGDFKFFAALGAWFGWQALPLLLLIASVSTILFLALLKICKKYPENPHIPLGPGLAFAGACFFITQCLTSI